MVPIVLLAQDIRDRVVQADDIVLKAKIIDPDNHVYGIPFGTSEDDFIKAFGKPIGYVRLGGKDTVMMYGKEHLFLFSGGKLSGVRISSYVLDWKVARRIPRHRLFDGLKWKLDNGITVGKTLVEVKKILGDSLSAGGYQKYYLTESARVELDFSHYVDEGEDDDAYRVSGVFVERK
jgi:hypothetical protein